MLFRSKTIEPLVAELKKEFSHWKKGPRFSIITNGSLLSEKIIDWCVENLGGMAVSHDGPGQHIRGPDPLMDENQRKMILELYRRMNGRMSFNAMVNSGNTSRKKISEWFRELTGDDIVHIGEGGFVDAYDEGGLENSLKGEEEHIAYRRLTLHQTRTKQNISFNIVNDRMKEWVFSISANRPAESLGQKCGMDSIDTIAVDLRGNVLTCQNVSAEIGRAHV